NQLEFDDETAFQAVQKVYDLARGRDTRPWMLTVSFTHPHDPYVARRKYWNLYEDCAHLDPEVPAIPYGQQDPHSQRIFDANDWQKFAIDQEDIRRSRRAYFANISYLDDKIGEILTALENTRQEAVVVFTADHGDMLGERGLWFKMSFHEGSSRVPIMVAVPGLPPGRVDRPVSVIDICPTLAALGGVAQADVAPWTDGENLVDVAATGARAPVPIEYAAEASQAPLVCLVEGRWKYTRCALDPDQLFDLETDPHERTDLAADPAHAETLAHMRSLAEARWDLAAFDASVRESQARRLMTYDALRKGRYTPWEHQPDPRDAERFMRNHMDLNIVEESQRFPRGE
ncbi:MAG: choline-sulfatase, partial [Maritimibacter sp.]|nr:choline-sulfatase [Maritimibacter sp.]